MTAYRRLAWTAVTGPTELAEVVDHITYQRVVMNPGATWDYFPGHYDPDYAEKHGHPSIFVNTMHLAGFIDRIATDWAGPYSRVAAARSVGAALQVGPQQCSRDVEPRASRGGEWFKDVARSGLVPGCGSVPGGGAFVPGGGGLVTGCCFFPAGRGVLVADASPLRGLRAT